MYAQTFQPPVLDRDLTDFQRRFEALRQRYITDHFRQVDDFCRSYGADPQTHGCFSGFQSKEDGYPVYTYVLVPLDEWDRVEGLTLAEAARSYPSIRLEWTNSGVVEVTDRRTDG